MEENGEGTSSRVLSEPASSSRKRNGNGLEEKDELGSKRVKVSDPDNDNKPSNVECDKVIGSTSSSEQIVVTTDSEGLGRLNREKDKVIKPSIVHETKTCLPMANSGSTVANSGKALLENNTVNDKNGDTQGGNVDVVSKKLKETSETVVRGAVDSSVSVSVPSSEKGSDSMRRWMEMKKNGFLSGPLGGVTAASSAAATAPVEVPAPKQHKNKRRSDSFKKRNEVPRKEQQLVDRFSNITAPSGLLKELNPGIINHVRSKKQVFSIIEALIRSANDDAVGERHTDLNVREPVREDNALTFKLPSTGVADNANSVMNPEHATSLAVEAATVASQWLEFLHQDLSGRLSAVQESRNRVQNILTTELPLIASSRESSSNQERTVQMTNMDTSGDASSDKIVTDSHQMRWSAKFGQINKALCDEERDLERSLNQVKEMQSRCNEGLRQMDEYSPFSSQSSDSSFGKDGSNMETSRMVQAAAASIFSTCSFLLSMMRPPPTGS